MKKTTMQLGGEYVGPVTALEACEDAIFVGCGSTVFRVNVSGDGKVTRTGLVLPKGNVVHGIRNKGSLVFGGRWVASASAKFMLKDAVLDASLISTNEVDIEALLALSSGRIVLCNLLTGMLHEVASPKQTQNRLYLSLCFGHDCTPSRLLIAGGSVMGYLQVWTNDEVCLLNGHSGAVFSERFSKDNNRLCTCGEDRSVRVWHRLHGVDFAQLWCSYGSEARVWDCLFAEVGVVSVGEDCFLNLWDKETGKLVACVSILGSPRCCAISNGMVLSGGMSGAIHAFDVDELILMRTKSNELGSSRKNRAVVSGLAVAGESCFAVTNEWTLLYYTSRELVFDHVMETSLSMLASAKNEIVKSIDCIDDSSLLLGSSFGRLIKLVQDKEEWKMSIALQCHNREVSVLTHGYSLVLSGSGDGFIRLASQVDLAEQFQIKLPTSKSSPSSACILAKFGFFAIGDSYGSVFILDTSSKAWSRIFRHLHGLMAVTMVAMHEEGFMSSGRNGLVAVSRDGRHCTNMHTKLGPLSQLERFSIRNGRLLVLGTVGESWYSFDATKQTMFMSIDSNIRHPIAWREGVGVISAGQSSILVTREPVPQTKFSLDEWNLRTGHMKVLWSCVWLNATTLVTVSEDERICVWRYGVCVALTDAPRVAIRSVSLLARPNMNQATLLVAGASGVVQCWGFEFESNRLSLLAEHRPELSETRILCTAASKVDPDTFFVGGSDGHIQKMHLQNPISVQIISRESSPDLVLDKKKRKLPSGLKLRPTVLTSMRIESGDVFELKPRAALCMKTARLGKQEFLAVGYSDGHVTIWNSISLKEVADLQVHQAGVVALDAEDGSDEVLLFSGGDDEAAAVVRIRLVQGMLNFDVSRADMVAAASITGITVKNQNAIFVASADQRLTRLQYTNGLLLPTDSQVVLDVGDVNDLQMNSDGSVLAIVGVGVEFVDCSDLGA